MLRSPDEIDDVLESQTDETPVDVLNAHRSKETELVYAPEDEPAFIEAVEALDFPFDEFEVYWTRAHNTGRIHLHITEHEE